MKKKLLVGALLLGACGSALASDPIINMGIKNSMSNHVLGNCRVATNLFMSQEGDIYNQSIPVKIVGFKSVANGGCLFTMIGLLIQKPIQIFSIQTLGTLSIIVRSIVHG